MRGVLEIIRPLEQDIERTRAGLRSTFVLVGVVSVAPARAVGLGDASWGTGRRGLDRRPERHRRAARRARDERRSAPIDRVRDPLARPRAACSRVRAQRRRRLGAPGHALRSLRAASAAARRGCSQEDAADVFQEVFQAAFSAHRELREASPTGRHLPRLAADDHAPQGGRPLPPPEAAAAGRGRHGDPAHDCRRCEPAPDPWRRGRLGAAAQADRR